MHQPHHLVLHSRLTSNTCTCLGSDVLTVPESSIHLARRLQWKTSKYIFGIASTWIRLLYDWPEAKAEVETNGFGARVTRRVNGEWRRTLERLLVFSVGLRAGRFFEAFIHMSCEIYFAGRAKCIGFYERETKPIVVEETERRLYGACG
jgi:hypothetical protein